MFSHAYIAARTALIAPTLNNAVTNMAGTVTTTTTAISSAGSNKLQFADTSTVFPGFGVTGTGIPASNTVTIINSGSVVSIAKDVTANVSSAAVVTFTNAGTVNGAVASGNTIVLDDVAQLSTIQSVTGPNIAAASTVASIDTGANSITLNNAISGAVTNNEVLTFSQKQTLTAITKTGANKLALASTKGIIAGMVPQSGTLIPSDANVINVGTSSVTMADNVIANLGSGATITFSLPAFNGLTVNAASKAVSDTQTLLHVDLISPGGQMQLSASSLIGLGNVILTAVEDSSGSQAIINSLVAIDNRVAIDLLVTA